MTLERTNLAKVLYFDMPEKSYTAALANDWVDYDHLVKSIRMGCKRGVDKLLDLGCRVNKPGRYGSPLSMVVNKGWTNVAMKMLENGAKVSDAGWIANSPLRCAFFKKNLPEANSLINAMLEKHLMDKRTDFTHADGLGFFHIACAKGALKHVKDFLRDTRILNVNSQVSYRADQYAGYSALHMAVKFQRNDVLALLLKHNANTNVQDAIGLTPLHLALYNKNWKAVDLLLSVD